MRDTVKTNSLTSRVAHLEQCVVGLEKMLRATNDLLDAIQKSQNGSSDPQSLTPLEEIVVQCVLEGTRNYHRTDSTGCKISAIKALRAIRMRKETPRDVGLKVCKEAVEIHMLKHPSGLLVG